MSFSKPPPRLSSMISLKVDNLNFKTTSEDLRRLFERYGEVGDIYIPRNRYTRESRGFAFVRFYDKRDAEAAIDEMDGRVVDGRTLRVQKARYARPASPRRRRRRSRSPRHRSYSRSRSHERRSISYSKSHSRSRSGSKTLERHSKSVSPSKS